MKNEDSLKTGPVLQRGSSPKASTWHKRDASRSPTSVEVLFILMEVLFTY